MQAKRITADKLPMLVRRPYSISSDLSSSGIRTGTGWSPFGFWAFMGKSGKPRCRSVGACPLVVQEKG